MHLEQNSMSFYAKQVAREDETGVLNVSSFIEKIHVEMSGVTKERFM